MAYASTTAVRVIRLSTIGAPVYTVATAYPADKNNDVNNYDNSVNTRDPIARLRHLFSGESSIIDRAQIVHGRERPHSRTVTRPGRGIRHE